MADNELAYGQGAPVPKVPDISPGFAEYLNEKKDEASTGFMEYLKETVPAEPKPATVQPTPAIKESKVPEVVAPKPAATPAPVPVSPMFQEYLKETKVPEPSLADKTGLAIPLSPEMVQIINKADFDKLVGGGSGSIVGTTMAGAAKLVEKGISKIPFVDYTPSDAPLPKAGTTPTKEFRKQIYRGEDGNYYVNAQHLADSPLDQGIKNTIAREAIPKLFPGISQELLANEDFWKGYTHEEQSKLGTIPKAIQQTLLATIPLSQIALGKLRGIPDMPATFDIVDRPDVRGQIHAALSKAQKEGETTLPLFGGAITIEVDKNDSPHTVNKKVWEQHYKNAISAYDSLQHIGLVDTAGFLASFPAMAFAGGAVSSLASKLPAGQTAAAVAERGLRGLTKAAMAPTNFAAETVARMPAVSQALAASPQMTRYVTGTLGVLSPFIDNTSLAVMAGASLPEAISQGLVGVAPAIAGTVGAKMRGKRFGATEMLPDDVGRAAEHLERSLPKEAQEAIRTGTAQPPEYISQAYRVRPDEVQQRMVLNNTEKVVKDAVSRGALDPRATQETIVNAADHPELVKAVELWLATRKPLMDGADLPADTLDGARMVQAFNRVLRQTEGEEAFGDVKNFIKDNAMLASYDQPAFFEKLRKELPDKANVLENAFENTTMRETISHSVLEILQSAYGGKPQDAWIAGVRRPGGELLVKIGEVQEMTPELQKRMESTKTRYMKQQAIADEAVKNAKELLAEISDRYPYAKDLADGIRVNLEQVSSNKGEKPSDFAGRLQELQRVTGEDLKPLKKYLSEYSQAADKSITYVEAMEDMLRQSKVVAPLGMSQPEPIQIVQRMLSPGEGFSTRQQVEAAFGKMLSKINPDDPHYAIAQGLVREIADDIHAGGSRDPNKYNPDTNEAMVALQQAYPGYRKMLSNLHEGMSALSKEADLAELLGVQHRTLLSSAEPENVVGYLVKLRQAARDFQFEHNQRYLQALREDAFQAWEHYASRTGLPEGVKQRMFDFITGDPITRAKLASEPDFLFDSEHMIQNALDAAYHVPRMTIDAVANIHQEVFGKPLDRELYLGMFLSKYNNYNRTMAFEFSMLDEAKVRNATELFSKHKESLEGVFSDGYSTASLVMEQNIARNSGVAITFEALSQKIKRGIRDKARWIADNVQLKDPIVRRMLNDRDHIMALHIIDGMEGMPAFFDGMKRDGRYYRTSYGEAVHSLVTKHNESYRRMMAASDEQGISQYIFNKVYNSRASAGEKITTEIEAAIRKEADMTYKYLKDAALTDKDVVFWERVWEGREQFKRWDLELWQANKAIYEVENKLKEGTGRQLYSYDWREQYVKNKRASAAVDPLQYDMRMLLDPDMTKQFGSTNQLAKAQSFKFTDAMQSPIEMVMTQAQRVFVGGLSAHERAELESTGALLHSAGMRAYGTYVQEMARVGGRTKMNQQRVTDQVMDKVYGYMAKHEMKNLAEFTQYLQAVTRVFIGGEGLLMSMFRGVSVLGRIAGGTAAVVGTTPPGYLRAVGEGSQRPGWKLHATQATAQLLANTIHSILYTPYAMVRLGAKSAWYGARRTVNAPSLNVSKPMRASLEKVLDNLTEGGVHEALSDLYSAAHLSRVEGYENLPWLRANQALSRVMGWGTRKFMESFELGVSQMALEHRARVYETAVFRAKEGGKQAVYEVLNDNLAQPATTNWKLAGEIMKGVESGDPYGEAAVAYLQQSHAATVGRYGPLSTPGLIRDLSTILPGMTLFYNAKLNTINQTWNQVRALANVLHSKATKSGIPSQYVPAATFVLASTISTSASLYLWQHGLPKPLADIIREDNEQGLLHTFAEGPFRALGVDSDKWRNLSFTQLNPFASTRGSPVLPVSAAYISKAGIDYWNAFGGEMRAKLADVDRQLNELPMVAMDEEARTKKLMELEQKRIDIPLEYQTRYWQRLFSAVEDGLGIPGLTFLRDSFSPINLVYAVVNDRLEYNRLMAERMSQPKEGDLAFSDQYTPYLTLRKAMGWDEYVGTDYGFDYDKFVSNTKDFWFSWMPEPLRTKAAEEFAGTCRNLHDSMMTSDTYLNGLYNWNVLQFQGAPMQQGFSRDVSKLLYPQIGPITMPQTPTMEDQSVARRAEILDKVREQMKPKAGKKEKDDTNLFTDVLNLMTGRVD